MKVAVVYDTVYGNTEKIAKTIASALKNEKIDVKLLKASSAEPKLLLENDVLLLGGPTHNLGMSEPMKALMSRLRRFSLKNKFVATFDTKYRDPEAGSAAHEIQRIVEGLGATRLEPPFSTFVKMEEDTPLFEREEERAREYGLRIKAKLLDIISHERSP